MRVVVHNVLTRCYVQRYTPIFYVGLSGAVSRLVLLPLVISKQGKGGFLLADEIGKGIMVFISGIRNGNQAEVFQILQVRRSKACGRCLFIDFFINGVVSLRAFVSSSYSY